jgi:hypothetical protein
MASFFCFLLPIYIALHCFQPPWKQKPSYKKEKITKKPWIAGYENSLRWLRFLLPIYMALHYFQPPASKSLVARKRKLQKKTLQVRGVTKKPFQVRWHVHFATCVVWAIDRPTWRPRRIGSARGWLIAFLSITFAATSACAAPTTAVVRLWQRAFVRELERWRWSGVWSEPSHRHPQVEPVLLGHSMWTPHRQVTAA